MMHSLVSLKRTNRFFCYYYFVGQKHFHVHGQMFTLRRAIFFYFIGGSRGARGGGCSPLKRKFRGHSPPRFGAEVRQVTKYKNHLRSFRQNSCHQNATRRDPQTVKVVFDIICGIGDFRAYIFCPPSTQELHRKHNETVSSEQVPTYALSQIDYGHTVDTFEIAKRFPCAKELRKEHFWEIRVGVCAWLGLRSAPPRLKTLRRLSI